MTLQKLRVLQIRGVKGEAVVKNPDQRSGLLLKKKPD
jgi:hypothetical protein